MCGQHVHGAVRSELKKLVELELVKEALELGLADGPEATAFAKAESPHRVARMLHDDAVAMGSAAHVTSPPKSISARSSGFFPSPAAAPSPSVASATHLPAGSSVARSPVSRVSMQQEHEAKVHVLPLLSPACKS